MSTADCPACVQGGAATPADLGDCQAMTISFALRLSQLDLEAVQRGVMAAIAEAGQHVEYTVARGLMQYEPGLFPEAGMMLRETHDGPHDGPRDPAAT